MAYDSHPDLKPGEWGSGENTPIEYTARFDHVVKFIDDKGGRYQQSRAEFVAELDVSQYCLRRVLERGKKLGLLRVIPTAHPMVGQGGRFPSIYELQMTRAEWLERRDEIVGAMHEQRARIRKAAKLGKRKPTKTLTDVPTAAALARAPRPIPFGAPAATGAIADDFDVDAWSNAVDFD